MLLWTRLGAGGAHGAATEEGPPDGVGGAGAATFPEAPPCPRGTPQSSGKWGLGRGADRPLKQSRDGG